MSKRQHADADNTLNNATEYRRAHVAQGISSTLLFSLAIAGGKCTTNVGTKLNRYTDRLTIEKNIGTSKEMTREYNIYILTITRLTREIALSSMSQMNMIPTISMIIIATTTVTISAVNKSNESRTNMHMKIEIRVVTSWAVASCQIFKYCS